jgi:putative ABC transport system permease protein
MSAPLEPGRVWRWWLRRCLPPGVAGASQLGDLLEDFRARSEQRGITHARRWFRRQAVALMCSAVVGRVATGAAAWRVDFVSAARAWRRQRSLAVTVIATIGLALGANTALFSVFDGLLFRPLPYRDGDRLVRMDLQPAALTSSMSEVPLEAMLERAQATSLLVDRVAARPMLLFDPTSAALTEWQLRPSDLSHTAFEGLGVYPVLGRPFTAADSTTPRTEGFKVLLGFEIWQRYFGADAGVVGRMIQIPGTSPLERYEVVGIMPKGFAFPDGANFWIPVYPFYPSSPVVPFARLAPGATIEQVRAELPAVTVTPLREYIRPQGAEALGVLMTATALLLLLAMVQIAALLFARAAGRTNEIGTRLALGASRGRVTRQFVLESIVLIIPSLALAAWLAPMLTTMLVAILPAQVTVGQIVTPDARALLFAGAMAALGVAALAWLPADLVWRAQEGYVTRPASGATTPRVLRIRTLLFIGQLGVATCLAYLAGTAYSSLVSVHRTPLGFSPVNLVAVRMPGTGAPRSVRSNSRGALDAQRVQVAQTIDALSRLDDVVAVSGGHSLPFAPWQTRATVLPSEADPARTPISGREEHVVLGFPLVLASPLLSGAEPSPQEMASTSAPPALQVALVNETLARWLSQFGPPVGQVVAPTSSRRYRVVGVIADLRLDRVDRPAEPTLYAYLPPPAAVGVVLARLKPSATPDSAGLSTVLTQVWGDRAPQVQRVEDLHRAAQSDYQARSTVLAAITILSLPLTLLGVAGALMYLVRQQTRQLAIELALGATPRDLERKVVRHALRATTIGIGLGLAAGIGLSRLATAWFHGVPALDIRVLAGSVVLIAAVALLASWVPVRRAGRINPSIALRQH